MNVQCSNPHCREAIRVPPGYPDDTIECPKCGRQVPLGSPEDATLVDVEPEVPIDATPPPPPPPPIAGVKVECPNRNCRTLVEIPLDRKGTELRCPKCGRAVPLPTPDEKTLADDSPVSEDPLVGETLGHFAVLEKLGEGGMASVYRARNLSLNKVVALKVLPPVLTRRDPKFVERFMREARAAAQIDHPNIVSVHFVGEDKGYHFLEMAFIKGQSLGDVFRSGRPLDIEEAVRIITEAARGLSAAHKRGVIHRDVKPDNILMDNEGRVMISDFGLAKAPSDGSDITVAGRLLGTPFYMSPEQCEGKEADTRSDIYALGITFYEAVTGKRPFSGDTLLTVMRQHQNEPLPSPKLVNPWTPEPICRIIYRMTAKDPTQRYQSCDEIIHDLEHARTASFLRVLTQALRLIACLVVIGGSAAAVYTLLNMEEVRQALSRRWQQHAADPEPADPIDPAPPPETPLPTLPPKPPADQPPPELPPHPLTFITGPLLEPHLEPHLGPKMPAEPPEPAPDAVVEPAPEPAPEPPVPEPPPGEKPDEHPAPPKEPAPTAVADMVLIPAGSFLLGDSTIEEAKPMRMVYLDAFYIDKHEVTNAQYREFVAATHRPPPPHWGGDAPPDDRGDHPVTFVNWHDAAAYCKWAGKALPTEAQWERACSWNASAKKKRAYPWGKSFDPLRVNAIYKLGCPADDVQAWTALWLFGPKRKAVCEAGGNTVPVTDWQVEGDITPEGVLGMASNVSEWCADWFAPNAYAELPEATPKRNPNGPAFGRQRVVRGGNWFSTKDTMRAAARKALPPDAKVSMVGFRCVKPVSGAAKP